MAEKWREERRFKVEADAVGDKVVMSASLKVKQKKDAISIVFRENRKYF